MKEQTLKRAEGRIHLTLRALTVGADLCIILEGGQKPHIGAVALAAEGEKSRVMGLPGHREDELAEKISRRVQQTLGGTVSVACGIHLKDITPDEIETVLRLSEELVDQLLQNAPGVGGAS